MAGITPRVIDATIQKWAKKMSDFTVARYLFLAQLKKKGKIKGDAHGTEMIWPWEWRRHPLESFEDAIPQQITRQRTTKTSTLPWRGYQVGDARTHQEKAQCDGDEAKIKLLSTITERMRRNATRGMGRQWYLDGNATTAATLGSGNPPGSGFHGAESIFGITPGGQTATDEFATVLADTYGGQSTAYTAHTLGPTPVKGTDPEYGVYSPVVVNCNRTVGGSPVAWDANADGYIRSGIIEASRDTSEEERPDMGFLTRTAFRELADLMSTKEQLTFAHGNQGDKPAGFGFGPLLYIDGVPFTYDDGVPLVDANSDTVYGYMFNFDRMELVLCGQSDLWEGFTEFNMRQKADEFSLISYGNLKFESPRHQTKFAAIS